MDKFTPGPWTAILDKPTEKRYRMALVGTTAGNAAIDCTRSGESFAQDCANARLVAAAPDLLNSLREAVAMLDAIRKYAGDERMASIAHKPSIEVMRIAIAKADGTHG